MFIEKSLIIQLKQGSTRALELLHEQFSTKIYNAARRFFLTHEDAEEVVQDVFIKIWNNRNNIKLHLSFKAYIFKISKNLILKKLQRKVLKETLDNYMNNAAIVSEDVEEVVMAQDIEALINELINNLPPKKQKIFLLNRYEGKTVDEIVSELGISRRTVESHIYQTRALIKGKLNINSAIPLLIISFL